MNLTNVIAAIPDYLKPGVIFRDITPLLADGKVFQQVIDQFAERYRPLGVTKVVGIEARGFIFATALAYALGIGFVPLRKPGKLPRATLSQTYALEYGEDTLEIHVDDIQPGERVVIMDDLLATGGTVMAAIELLRRQQADIVECAFVITLNDLEGHSRLANAAIPYYTLCTF